MYQITGEEILRKIIERGFKERSVDDILYIRKRLPRLGVYDLEDESDDEEADSKKKEFPCNIPSCQYIGKTLLQFENHYNAVHRYSCAQCKKILPTPHFLDLHIQENHDSYFAAMAERKPSYSCYIQECKLKFNNDTERFDHCVKDHKLPKDFRFNQKKKKKTKDNENAMNVDAEPKRFHFNNSKQKTFTNKYSGKKFTKDKKKKEENEYTMDYSMDDLKNSLPE